jgi:predicted permease
MLLFAVAPTIRSLRTPPIEAMKSSDLDGRRVSRARLSSGLVVTQVAIAIVLVTAFTMFGRTIGRLANADLGFDRDRVLLVGVDASRATVVEADRTAFYARLVEAVRAVRGVNAAGGSLSTPLGSTPGFPIVVTPLGSDSATSPATRAVELNGITPGWRSTYGVALVSGRDVDERDRADTQPVMVVNEAFARRFLPDTNPVGTSVNLAAGTVGELAIGVKTVVGVIANMAWRSVRSTNEPAMYIPVTQWPNPLHPTTVFSLSVRSAASSPALLAPDVRSTLLALDGGLVLSIRPLDAQVGTSLIQERLLAQLSAFFGGLGVLLAGIGLYGVTSHAVGLRRAEFGIRLAIGASPSGIVRLVLSRVAILMTAGVVIGVITSRWLSTLVAGLLYGIEPNDWSAVLTAVLALGAIGGLAGWIPARRAARVDPSTALKST